MSETIMRGISPLAVANTFLEMAKIEGRSTTQIEIQKLVYFAHGWHLAVTGNPLINERVEAWPYGPVIESVYHAFKHCGNSPISSLANQPSITTNEVLGEVAKIPSDVDPVTINIIKKVYDKYKNLSASQFVEITHRPGTPWRVIADACGGTPRSLWIPDEKIREHFVDIASRNKIKTHV